MGHTRLSLRVMSVRWALEQRWSCQRVAGRRICRTFARVMRDVMVVHDTVRQYGNSTNPRTPRQPAASRAGNNPLALL